MNFEIVMHYIAQGAINISEGITQIEDGSPVHKAMLALCEMVNAGQVVYRVPPDGKRRQGGR